MIFIGVNLIIFLICLSGIFFNFRNILIVLMGIELMLLSLNLNFIYFPSKVSVTQKNWLIQLILVS